MIRTFLRWQDVRPHELRAHTAVVIDVLRWSSVVVTALANGAAWVEAYATPEEVVGAWASEDAFYDYDANACAADQQCGHYTQIVWRETERVGCGASTCTIDGFDGLFWVCNYDPPGNFVGERPY